MEIVKCGFYKVEVGGKVKIRSRGIGPTDEINLETYMVKRRYGMNQAIRNDWERMNIIEPREITQNLNTDKKRIWDGDLPRDYKKREIWMDSMAIVV